MDTKRAKPAARRRRRRHEPEFKAQVIEACLEPGVSVAAVALANGLHANFLRRWVKEHREQAAGNATGGCVVVSSHVKPAALVPVTVKMSDVAGPSEIRIDIRCGATAVQMAWPVADAAMLGQWLKYLLR